ncbi:MAG: hypothetical protein DRJ01_09660 [Bacteroidetes bacterium]|nr:MAG: hypothetical protein DRJ01_09660 [Bacteroidota bacterium]
MRHILVPIDFSEDSLHALKNAIEYANKLKANIRLIHVTKKYIAFNEEINLNKNFNKLNSSIEDYLNFVIDKYKSKLNGTFDYKIREGKVYAEITNQAKYDNALMIVMGTHGMSGFEARWIGCNAFRVVVNSACPVVTIRRGFEKNGVKKIVMPIDLSSESRQKVPFVTNIAKQLGADIYLLDICSSDKDEKSEKLKDYSRQVAEYINKNDVSCIKKFLVGNSMTDTVVDFSNVIDADLIAIMTEQSESAKDYLIGTYAQQMINHSPIPVISFNPV